MTKILVELVKYDMDKTKKRKRKDFFVDSKSQSAIIERLERIHKGEKVQAIHEIVWGQEADQGPEAEVFTGTVKFFDEVKGFGFISADADIDDLFFHASALNGEFIPDGGAVSFEISEGPKGLIAIRIELVD